MGRMTMRLASVGLIALAASGTGLAAGPASAATGPTGTAVSAALQCGWHPANDANVSGTIEYAAFSPGLHNGPDYGCSQILSYWVNEEPVTIHCGWFNPSEGIWWDYVYDSPNGVYGWIPDSDVSWKGAGDGC